MEPRQNKSLSVWLAEVVFVAILYFATARMCQLLAIAPGNVTPVWIPSGIILAAVLLRGYGVWPGIFLGAFAGNAWAYFDVSTTSDVMNSLLAATSNGIGDVLCAVGGAYLIRRTTGTHLPFDSAEHVAKFIVFGVLLGPLVSAIFGVTSLCMAGFKPWADYGITWLTWWTGDAVGVLTITPAIMVWTAREKRSVRLPRILEGAALFVLLVATNIYYPDFLHSPHWVEVPLCVNLLVLVWAVFRLGQRMALAALVLASAVAVVAMTTGHGPYAGKEMNASLIELQLYLAAITTAILLLCGISKQSKQAEQRLRDLNANLEQRILERTGALRVELAERKRVQGALAAAKQELQAIVDASPLAILALDARGYVTMWNDSAERIFGWSASEVIGRPNPIVPEDKQEEFQSNFRSTLAGQDLVNREARRRRKDGSLIDISLSASSLADSRGNIIGTVAVIADVTEQKRVEEALQESETRYRMLMDTIPHGVQENDVSGIITFSNAAHHKMNGYGPSELIGMCIWDLLASDTEKQELQQHLKYLVKEQPPPTPWVGVNRAKDGRLFDVEVDWNYQRDERGQVTGFISVITDVTERKKAEEVIEKAHGEMEQRVVERTAELVQANEQLEHEVKERSRVEIALRRAERLASLGTLAAGIAHEINNPLQVITMSAELALQTQNHPSPPQTTEEVLREIQDQAFRCGRIVKSILQFAREETTEMWPCSLATVVNRVQDQVRMARSGEEILIGVELPDELPDVMMNPTEMEQVLLNLTNNAIRASDPGGRVTIRVDAASDIVRVRIKDRGCGMTKEQARRVFDPFFTTHQHQGGIGLGLSVSHGIVEDHGGTIAVESTLGEGSTFTLTLPVNPSPEGGNDDD